jgi:hypothetical protein
VSVEGQAVYLEQERANMLDDASFTDPWLRTLGLLSAISDGTGVDQQAATAVRFGRKGGQPAVAGQRFEAQVQVLDRPTQSTATVAWRSSTLCSYGDQVWHASRARVAGTCVLSGLAITPGDPIYKPRPYRTLPLNAGAMILQSVLHEAVLIDPAAGAPSCMSETQAA